MAIRLDEASSTACSSVSAQIVHTHTATRGAAKRSESTNFSRYSEATAAPWGLMKSANEYGSPISPAQIALWGEEPSSHGSGRSGSPGRTADRRAKGWSG